MHAVVIGTGFGGLAAALRLCRKGYRVTVLERLEGPGGRAFVYEQDGFTFDAGPTIITAPFLLEELWAMCGRRFSDDVDLRPMWPFYRIRFDDGSHFDYFGETEAMRREITRLAGPSEVAGYDAFMREAMFCLKLGYEELGTTSFVSLMDLIAAMPSMVRMQAWKTIYSMARRHFKNEKLRQVFSFHPLLIGGNPFSVTQVYSLITGLEREYGVHSAMGGTGAIVKALARLVEDQGAVVRYNAEVGRILLEGRRAVGVELSNGERISADMVVSNADAANTYRKLLPNAARRVWTDAKVERAAYSMGLFVWYFGTRRRYEDIPHHMILLGPRYKGLLQDIFKRKVLSKDFSLYLHRPTATDPALAPAGCDTFYVLSPVPHLDADVDWAQTAEPYRQTIAAYLEQSVLPGLSAEVCTSKVVTPLDFESRLWAYKGAAFGMEPRLTQSAWFRPHNQNEDIEALYMVGAGTHPGAGVPGVLSSAKAFDSLIKPVGRRPIDGAPYAEPQAAPWVLPAVGPAGWPEPEAHVAKVSEEELMRGGSKSFFAASRLLPKTVRNAAVDLYAYCRVADDRVDESLASPEVMQELHDRLNTIYSVQSPADLPMVDKAFWRVVSRYQIPKAVPLALLEGFEWDAQGRVYETIEDVFDYGARVAGTVGAMMALVMGVREARPMARACELGVAMQLTNIARDVGEDARMGRLYLPRQWMREEGIDPQAWLERPSFSPALGRVVDRLLKEADGLYKRAEEGVSFLPRGCRPAIMAARHIYSDIGREIGKADFNSIDRRAVVASSKKIQRLFHCLPAALLAPRMPRGHTPLPAIAFLVEASGISMRSRPPRTVGEKAGWMVDLFLTLAERERQGRVPR
jgi:phytoene desaturase